MWAAANPTTRHLVDGIELADSWACDGHKWLNVPYDSGYAFCARPQVHADAIRFTAPYLVGAGAPVASLGDLTLDSSRRARGFATWAAIRQLGRTGIADLVERCCRLARRFADGLADGGAEIANEVVLNQVLAGFGNDARTDAVIDAVQRDGTCWLGGTTWRGRRLMRVSVSNATTTEDDIDRSVAAILRCAEALDTTCDRVVRAGVPVRGYRAPVLRRIALVTVAFTAALGLAACGDDDDAASPTTGGFVGGVTGSAAGRQRPGSRRHVRRCRRPCTES